MIMCRKVSLVVRSLVNKSLVLWFLLICETLIRSMLCQDTVKAQVVDSVSQVKCCVSFPKKSTWSEL